MADTLKETKPEYAITPAIEYAKRLDQQGLEPTSVKARTRSEASILSSSILQANNSPGISNGQQTTATITFSVPDTTLNFKSMIQPEVTVYVNSVTAAQQLPGGAAIDESQWQVIGPFMDTDASDGKNMVARIYHRNISAGAGQILIYRIRARGISQTDASTEGAS